MILPLVLMLVQAPEPRALVERTMAATKAQAAERARYFGREDIQTFRVEGTKRKKVSWHVYEAMILEGRIRFKRTWNDGKPIPVKKQRLQPPDKRWGMRYEQVLEHHELTLVGAETLDGRAVWRMRTRLKPGAPFPSGLDDLALTGPLELWIDQESGMDVQSRLTVERRFRGLERGTVIETKLMKVDNVFVAARAFIRIPTPKGAIETVQAYTEYRRFSSDVTIRFEADPETDLRR